MHSQLYLTGRLVSNPELSETKKGRLRAKLVLETNFARETRPGEYQTEVVVLPIQLFSLPAEQVKDLKEGDVLTVGAHVYGPEFQPPDGIVKRGIQLIADAVFIDR
jgi:single-stranded DNA-binding protein